MKKWLLIFFVLLSSWQMTQAQYSVARRWNEVLVMAIRQDLARPPVQARNLYHFSLAAYEAWAAYDPKADNYLLGHTRGGNTYSFNGLPAVVDTLAAQNMAISYACYRLLKYRFRNSPNAAVTLARFDTLMINLGYDTSYYNIDYQTGTPADLGNYIAQMVKQFGWTDGSNELGNYAYQVYAPVNLPMHVDSFGNSTMSNVNKWQPLTLSLALDQGGNPIPSTPAFIGPEWGNVLPFGMNPLEATWNFRGGMTYPVYKNPQSPPNLSLSNPNDSASQLFKMAHLMVPIWQSHLDPDDTTTMDISPGGHGNTVITPSTISEAFHNYYNYFEGGDTGKGHALNPITNMPYTPNIVRRGDYARVASQFWADGPHSETPPGHWFVLLNDVSDHPLFERKMYGDGPTLSSLEWDVKSYFMLGGAMHDAAIAAWGVKGWYDHPRPISMIRKMASLGQSSNPSMPNYHPGGLPLIPGYCEMITAGDSLAGPNNEYVNKLKLYTWRGFSYIADSSVDVGHVGWILAERWMPYQRKTFVTPPFAGYVSGHSTYSRTAAEIMTLITGSPFFPGGLAEYEIPANSGFLVFEKGPSVNVKLQWATYYDASNEASLSRIWGGIHPPFDDMPGRLLGMQVAQDVFNTAKLYFNSSPLPLSLQSFTVVEKNCEASIEWETTNEQNVASFTVMASTDGEHFDRKVGTLNAFNENSEQKKYYTITDKTPTKIGYYKLIENDIDAKSKTIAARYLTLPSCFDASGVESVMMYPNPVQNVLQLKFLIEGNKELAMVRLTDLLGRSVITQVFALTESASQQQMDVSAVPIGNYLLSVTLSNGHQYTQKLTKY